MSNIYDSPPPKQAGVLSANLTIETRPFDGTTWFQLVQQRKHDGPSIITLSITEVEGLVLELARVVKELNDAPVPEQLRLFDPDNPPLEAPVHEGRGNMGSTH